MYLSSLIFLTEPRIRGLNHRVKNQGKVCKGPYHDFQALGNVSAYLAVFYIYGSPGRNMLRAHYLKRPNIKRSESWTVLSRKKWYSLWFLKEQTNLGELTPDNQQSCPREATSMLEALQGYSGTTLPVVSEMPNTAIPWFLTWDASVYEHTPKYFYINNKRQCLKGELSRHF